MDDAAMDDAPMPLRRTTDVFRGQLPPAEPPPAEHRGPVRLYRDIAFAQPLGYRPLMLDLTVPPTAAPVPLVIHVYGGGFATGSHKHNALGAELGRRLTAASFAVAHVQYRHSLEAPFPAQLHDVKAAVRWLRQHAGTLGLDAGRFAAWGSSSGGHLATMLAVTGEHPDLEGTLGLTGPSSAIQAAVSWSAPVNLARLPPPPPGSPFHATGADPHDWLLGAPVGEAPHLAASATTSTYPTSSAAPLLLAHGDEDPAIPVDHSEEIAAAYAAAGAHAEFERISGAGHVFGEADRDRLITRGLAFLRAHLR